MKSITTCVEGGFDLESWRTDRAKGSIKTIGLNRIAKARLERNRASGRCFNGFVCQLVGLWEQDKDERIIGNKVRSIGVNLSREVVPIE